MITETGQVLEVGSGHAWVACRRQVDCARCAEGRGCGGGLLGRLLGNRLHKVRAVTRELPVSPGDRVLIGLDEDAVLRAAAAVYLAPLLGALGGGLAAAAGLPGSEAAAVAAAAAGLLLGLGWAGRYSRRHATDPRFQPVVLEKLSAEGCGPAP